MPARRSYLPRRHDNTKKTTIRSAALISKRLEDSVDAGRLRENPVLPAADELRAHFLRELRLQVEDRRPVGEVRDADRLDVRREEGAFAGEGVATAGRRRTAEDAEDAEENPC